MRTRTVGAEELDLFVEAGGAPSSARTASRGFPRAATRCNVVLAAGARPRRAGLRPRGGGDHRVVEEGAGLGGPRSGTFWSIVRDEGRNGGGHRSVLTLGGAAGGEAGTLPVFGVEEEALLFLRLGGLEGRWRAGETNAADLAAALAGSYRGVRRVVLGPFPRVGVDGSHEAPCLSRERFVDLLGARAER